MRVMGLVMVFLIVVTGGAHSQTAALLLFGGNDHKTFLGCLNCNKYDSGSICNRFGQKGSKFSTDSVWNSFGHFGSKFSSESPWNSFANSAPIIVDESGQSYGYLSSNRFHSNRTQIRALTELADFVAESDDLDRARDLFCER